MPSDAILDAYDQFLWANIRPLFTQLNININYNGR